MGGVKDKPTKHPDPYHTAYALSGCSIAQHKSDFDNLHAKTEHAKQFRRNFDGNYSHMCKEGEDPTEVEFENTALLGGILDNKLRRMHPIYNARYDLVEKARDYYRDN